MTKEDGMEVEKVVKQTLFTLVNSTKKHLKDGDKERFLWFWINPVGMLFILGHHSAVIHMEFPVVLALKWLTFKLGGANLYTNYTLPASVGIAVGVNILQAIAVVYSAYMTVR